MMGSVFLPRDGRSLSAGLAEYLKKDLGDYEHIELMVHDLDTIASLSLAILKLESGREREEERQDEIDKK